MNTDSSFLAELHPGIRQALVDGGKITTLREVQRRSILPLLTGENALIVAGTASGKTEAMLWPLLTRIAQLPSNERGIRFIVVAPLKALLNDLEGRVWEAASHVGLSAFKWHGDVSSTKKGNELFVPSDVLLTTPESLEVLVTLKHGAGSYLANVECIAVDEAHAFAASARGVQLVSLIERIGAATARDIQRVGLSATIGNPEEVLRWLCGSSGRPFQVIADRETSGTRHGDIRIDVNVSPDDRLRSVIKTCGGRKALVFAQSRREAESLASELNDNGQQRPHERIPVDVHHSSIATAHRQKAETAIRKPGDEGHRTIICTSTLELGIDIGHLDETVQLGPPPSVSSYLQRLGRTGRRGGEQRKTQILIEMDPEDDRSTDEATQQVALSVAVAQLGADSITEPIEISNCDFALAAQQILCLSLQRSGIREADAFEVLKRCRSFAGVDRSDVSLLCARLVSDGMLRMVDDLLVVGDRAEKELGRRHRDLYVVFDTERTYTVRHGAEEIGTVSAAYAHGSKVPFVLTLAGAYWKVIARDEDRRLLLVQPGEHAQPPYWVNLRSGFGVTRLVAQQVRKLACDAASLDGVRLNERGLRLLRSLSKGECIPPDGARLHALTLGGVAVTTYGGDRDNWMLAQYLETRLGVTAIEWDFVRVAVPCSNGDPRLVERIREAIDAIARTDASEAAELSQQFARRLGAVRETKFSRFVPPVLLEKELARGPANFDHLRTMKLCADSR